MYKANKNRYDYMLYNRCGTSGIKLPFVSLGLWHNFGEETPFSNAREMVLGAFDMGITHFDIANNYGPRPGTAEQCFGRILKEDLSPYRDELIISTKAGYRMWEGPYGDGGSKKYLVSSLDQSLKRLGIDYVDIFYHHRPDTETPLEETMDALAHIVRQGKALYVGLSNYSPEQTKSACDALNRLGVQCLIHQPRYSMFCRDIENGLLTVLKNEGVGCIAFSPLAQGLLTDRYLNGIPEGSRAHGNSPFLSKERVTKESVEKSRQLNEIAAGRGQSLSQMALAWALRDPAMTSLIIGASRLSQIEDNVKASDNLLFSKEELEHIDSILAQ